MQGQTAAIDRLEKLLDIFLVIAVASCPAYNPNYFTDTDNFFGQSDSRRRAAQTTDQQFAGIESRCGSGKEGRDGGGRGPWPRVGNQQPTRQAAPQLV
jgi:hypothetical protein